MIGSIRLHLAKAALLCGALGASGCQLLAPDAVGAGIGEVCVTDDDCQASTCLEGVCTVECGEGCPAPSTCNAKGFCTLPTLDIGDACAEASECKSGECTAGLCSKDCSTNEDCAEQPKAECIADKCQIPLHVGFIYVGVPQDEGWTLTHDIGKKDAEAALPWLRTEFVQNTFLPDDAQAAADAFIDGSDGFPADVVVANSFSLRTPMKAKAEEYPDKTFLVCSAAETTPNYGSYFARSYQAWYLAGYAAAQVTKTNRIGFMGSFVTPEVVRHINAFTRGAQVLKPNIEVEVRWEGFWFDLDPPDPATGKYDEEEIAEQLLATGCDVIGHNSDNGRVVEVVQKAHEGGAACTVDADCPGSTCGGNMECVPAAVYSFGNDNEDACNKGPDSCIGTPYWNWGPQYIRLFEEIHRGVYAPSVLNDNIGVDATKSIINFGLNDKNAVVNSNLKIAVAELLAKLATDSGLTIALGGGQSGYCSTGQREPACVEPGEALTDEELTTMCWFVKGVVEKTDPLDPLSADKDAQVPVGQTEIPPGSGNKPDCRINQ